MAPDPRVLVTGGAGFIGVPTVGRLLELGAGVVALDNGSIAPIERLAALRGDPRLDVVRCDVRDAAALRRAVEEARPTAVIHLAALHFIPYCVAHPRETLEVNLVGTQNLLDAVRDLGVERLVFPSTGDVYRPATEPHSEAAAVEPTNIYGATKLAGEWLVGFCAAAAPALAASVLRLFNVFGPGETNPHVLPTIVEQVAEGDSLRLGNLHPRRDYVFVDDVASILARVACGPELRGTFNVGSGTATSVEELVDMLRRITGRKLRIEQDPERVRAVDRPQLQADPTALRAALGELELTPLEEGLARTLAATGRRR